MTWKRTAALAAAAGYTLLLLLNPMGALSAAKDALALCANAVIPSLFPFFVCSGMLVELNVANTLGRFLAPVMRPVFRLGGGSGLAMIMGLISGYPVGAKTTVDLVNASVCSRSEGEKLLAFCNNSGPLFILGAVGSGMLGRPDIGVVLYLAHILSALTVALLLRRVPCEIHSRRMPARRVPEKSFGEILSNAIQNGAQLVFGICGYVILFAILLASLEQFGVIRLIASFGVDPSLARAFVFGFFEPTSGCMSASQAIQGQPVLLACILAAVIGWSGISIHLQVLGIIRAASLSPKYYFLGKLLMTLIAPLYTLLLFSFTPAAKQTFSAFIAAPRINGYNLYYTVTVFLIIWLVLMLAFLLTACLLYFLQIRRQRRK